MYKRQDIGSGLDVSTDALYVDVLDDGSDTAATLQASSGSWLGGAGSINLQDEYRQTIATLDNTTTMVEDILKNLGPAAEMGMTTVWVNTNKPWSKNSSDGILPDVVIEDLSSWLLGVANA